MAKRGPTYACQACGAVYHRWQGKCDACGTWSSLSEEAQAAPVPGGGRTPAGGRARGRIFALESLKGETQDALHRLDPLWEHLFPAEQARIVRSLVERVVVGPAGADIRLRLDGLGGLVRDLTAIARDALRAAA